MLKKAIIMKPRTFHTRVIAYKKGDIYLGVALDFDLLVQGDSLNEALVELKNGITSYLMSCMKDNEADEKIYRTAPKKYLRLHDLFLDLQKNQEQSKQYEENYLGNIGFRKEEFSNV